MMRIVLYAKGFPPREYGGPVMAAYHLLRGLLRSEGVHVTLFVQTGCTQDEILSSLGRPSNLDVIRLRYYLSLNDLTIPSLAARPIREADVVHFNSFPFRHLSLLLFAKMRGVPTVFRVGGLLSGEIETVFGPAYPLIVATPKRRLRMRYPRSLARLLFGLYRWTAPRWTGVIMNSHGLKHRASMQENFDPTRIWIIPNGIDARIPPPSLPAPQDRRIRVLFVGKLEKVKGPDLLLSALDALKDGGVEVDLSIAGSGSMEAELRERAGDLKPHRTTFHGFRYGADLMDLYDSADIVVVPSRFESFPFVILEAMVAGRPIIATAVGGVPEVIRVPRNGLLVDPDPEALAQAIRVLANDPELRASMHKANCADVRQYSWESVVGRYLDVYERVRRGETPPAV